MMARGEQRREERRRDGWRERWNEGCGAEGSEQESEGDAAAEI